MKITDIHSHTYFSACDQQTNGRLWRQGQKSETVVVNHIITSGSIDERILAVLKSKDATQEELIAAVKAEV